MKNTATSPDNPWELRAFFVLAYVFSWSIGVPLALAQQGVIPAILPRWTHYLAAYGPLLAALMVTGVRQGPSGLKDLAKRMALWRSCPKWWVVINEEST